MAVHAVFVSPKSRNGNAIDRGLRERFCDVYRVGVEFWLVDSGRDADGVALQVRQILGRGDKMFVAALTRDTAAQLSAAARLWLMAPERSWRARGSGLGEVPAEGSLLGFAA